MVSIFCSAMGIWDDTLPVNLKMVESRIVERWIILRGINSGTTRTDRSASASLGFRRGAFSALVKFVAAVQ